MRLTGKTFDRTLLPYLLLAALALAHLLVLLSYIPYIQPYSLDDLGMASNGAINTPVELLHRAWVSMRSIGRLSLFLHIFLLCLSYHPGFTFILQPVPLLFSIITGTLLISRSTQSLRTALAFFIPVAAGSFVTDPHHLFGAYPAALPLGLTCSFAYLLLRLHTPDARIPLRVVSCILFVIPLFIYEAFFPIQIVAVAIIAAGSVRWRAEKGLLRRSWLFIKPLASEIAALGMTAVTYLVNALTRTSPYKDHYQGVVLAHSFNAFPYTFLKYATGFFHLPLPADTIILVMIPACFIYGAWKGRLAQATLAAYLLTVWLAPPLLLALTPKYQYWATLKDLRGSPIYVTTFLSELGCFGLLALLLASCDRAFALLAVTLISVSLWVGWREETAATLHERLTRFVALDAAIAEKKRNGEENCFTIAETKHILGEWDICEEGFRCKGVVAYLLTQRGSSACATPDNSH